MLADLAIVVMYKQVLYVHLALWFLGRLRG